MRESVSIKTNDCNFKFRVAGLIIRDNKLLVVKSEGFNFLALPGGYVELGETTEEALLRELKEEIVKEFYIKKYLGVLENYFTNKYNKKVHEISFYYLVDTKEELSKEDFQLTENDKGYIIKHNFKWIDIEKIDEYDIKPSFLKDILKNKELEFKHLVIKEY